MIKNTLSSSDREEMTVGEILTKIIRQRRSVFADSFIKKDIPREILEEILINATWAPTHKMTEPWRFIVLQGTQQEKFGRYMADYYKKALPEEEYTPSRYQQLLTYPLNAACMVAVILSHHPKISLPKWEELAAVSCAVQNMWLSCVTHDIGAYWESCAAAIEYVKQFGLDENEQCLGLFFMGYYDMTKTVSKKKRSPLLKKVSWVF